MVDSHTSDRIAVGDAELLCDLFNEWARTYGRPTSYGTYFAGQSGLWHALDELYPLQDSNRWNPLRLAVKSTLESNNWVHTAPRRGAQFEIRDRSPRV